MAWCVWGRQEKRNVSYRWQWQKQNQESSATRRRKGTRGLLCSSRHGDRSQESSLTPLDKYNKHVALHELWKLTRRQFGQSSPEVLNSIPRAFFFFFHQCNSLSFISHRNSMGKLDSLYSNYFKISSAWMPLPDKARDIYIDLKSWLTPWEF